MNKKDLEIMLYEIGKIRDRLIKKYDNDYILAKKANDLEEAIHICKKQHGILELESNIIDFITDLIVEAQE